MIKIVDVEMDHVKDLYRLEHDEEIAYNAGCEYPRSLEKIRETYTKYIGDSNSKINVNVILFGDEVIGKIELYTPENNIGYIGIILQKEYRGRGFATTTLKMIFEKYIFQKKIRILKAEIYNDNIESQRFFENNGFKYTGVNSSEMFRGEPRELKEYQYIVNYE